MSSLHILHVVDSLNPGGMENGIVNVANELTKVGVTFEVACLRERGSFADSMPQPDLVYSLGKKAGLSMTAIVRLATIIRRSSPDLIHTHNLGPLIYAGAASLGGTRIPILHGEHGQVQPPDLTPRRILLRRLLYKCCYTVHTVSKGLIMTLKQQGFSSDRITAIVNGVDCRRFRPDMELRQAIRAELKLPSIDSCVLGIVGRFVALKRHLMLFDALHRVMQHNPHVHLVVIGDEGSDKEAIVLGMKNHPFANRIHWLGMRRDMDRCYRALDLLVSPSEIEGLSNAVLEAMASGVPVLAHVACGNNEVIRDGIDGVLRELNDSTSLATALEETIKHPDRLSALGEAARARVGADFSIEAMAQNYLKVYERVAAG